MPMLNPMAFFSPIFSLASTIFMIWMLVDCIRNQTVKNKGGWIFFIIFTQFVGAAVYFFTRGPWPKVRQLLFPQNSFSQAPQAPQYQPEPAPQSEEFSAYERGYQAQQPIVEPASPGYPPESTTLQAEYEQPLLDYPELPPMEQHQ